MLIGRVVQVTTDNSVALHYVNKQGGTHSLILFYMKVSLWEWCYANHIYTVAVHISIQENHLVNHLSRLPSCSHEWSLDHNVFLSLCHKWSTLVTPENTKCSQNCTSGHILTRKCIHEDLGTGSPILVSSHTPHSKDNSQDAQDSTSFTLIAPWWPRQPWFTTL